MTNRTWACILKSSDRGYLSTNFKKCCIGWRMYLFWSLHRNLTSDVNNHVEFTRHHIHLYYICQLFWCSAYVFFIVQIFPRCATFHKWYLHLFSFLKSNCYFHVIIFMQSEFTCGFLHDFLYFQFLPFSSDFSPHMVYLIFSHGFIFTLFLYIHIYLYSAFLHDSFTLTLNFFTWFIIFTRFIYFHLGYHGLTCRHGPFA